MNIRPFLTPYVTMAKLLARTFPDAEVVVHDLADPQHSVVFVANGHITGRRPGESFEHLVTEAIKNGTPQDGILANYFFEKNNRLIRSSTLLIRDERETISGAVCINTDATQAAATLDFLSRQLLGSPCIPESLPHQSSPAAEQHSQSADKSVQDFVEDLIDRMICNLADTEKLSREQRLALLSFMQERGVFLVKGALERVAQRLGISKVRLYADLDALRKSQEKFSDQPKA